MDGDGGRFIVSTKIGELHFLPQPNGLYYLNMENLLQLNKAFHKKQQETISAKAAFMMDTVRQNYEGYTKQEVERAIGIRCLQGMLGNPSGRDLPAMVCVKTIKNCLFNAEDCKRPSKIFGKNLPDILGKMVSVQMFLQT